MEKQNSQSTKLRKINFSDFIVFHSESFNYFYTLPPHMETTLKRYLKQAIVWLRVSIFIWLLREITLSQNINAVAAVHSSLLRTEEGISSVDLLQYSRHAAQIFDKFPEVCFLC